MEKENICIGCIFFKFSTTMFSNFSKIALKMACVTVFERRSHLGSPAEGQRGPSDDDDDDGGLNLILVNLWAVRACPSLIMMLKNEDGNDVLNH